MMIIITHLTGMKFTWICFNARDKVPETFASNFSIPPYKTAVLTNATYDGSIIGMGGCFKDGRYFISSVGKLIQIIMIYQDWSY